MIRGWRVVLGLAPLLVLGCSKPEGESTTTAPATTPAAQAPAAAATATAAAPPGAFGDGPGADQAATIFKTRCSTCHGEDGKGHGPASITLNPKPRNYTDVAWQKSVTDDHIQEIIVKGGAAVGKSPLMPPNPDLVDKPDVVTALVHKVRSFGGAGDAPAPAAK